MVVGTALKGLAKETFSLFEKAMLDIQHRSRQSVSFEVSSRIATDLATRVMVPIYSQIDPESLGNDLRDLKIANAYGHRLARHSKNVRKRTVERLIEDYPSHDFIIDMTEAVTLFHRVEGLSESAYALINALDKVVYTPQLPARVLRLDLELEETSDVTTEETSDDGHREVDAEREAPGAGDQRRELRPQGGQREMGEQ